MIVAEPPDDPRVNVAIFTTNQTFDVRSESASRVSSYLNAGPEISGLLLENHIVGQRSIQILQRATDAPPSVGRTLLLRQDEGKSTQIEQFVRITRVTVEQRSFTYTISGGAGYSDFDANVVTCDLSDALRFDFKGTSANRNFTRDTAASKIRDTVVADAATYYGAVPLAAQAEIGDVYARVASVYTQLVPAAQSENPLVDQYHSGAFTNVLATTPRLVSVGGSPMSMRIKVQQENRGYNYVAILKPLPAKGSLRVVYRALGNTYSIVDDGSGNLTGNGSGTVNYTNGSVSVTLQAMPDDRSAVVFYWGPNQAFTDRSGQAGFRPPIVQLKLDHTFIEKGSVSVRWVSGGAVKTATDDGKGVFTGDATGGISYVSGDLFLEPAAFPDAGAEYQIEYEWSALVEEAKPGLAPDASGFVNLTLEQEPVPGSVVVSWATTRTVTTTSGASSSAAETAKNSSVGYTESQAKYEMDWYTIRGAFFYTGSAIFQNTSASNASSSHSVEASEESTDTVTLMHAITDDGAGVLAGGFGAVLYSAKSLNFKAIADFQASSYKSAYEDAASFEKSSEVNRSGDTLDTSDGANSLVVRYKVGTALPQAATKSITPPAITLDLCPYTSERVVPGSVRFTWMGTVYDDFEGVIYRGRTSTDAGVASGTIDYLTGVATMTDYVVSGNPRSFTLNSLWTRKGARDTIANITFNTELSPIKPGGLTVSVLDLAGTQIIATPDTNGVFRGTHVYGSIDYVAGLVELQFGDYVVAADLTDADKAEWWYSAADINLEGKIWRPWPVIPETLRYNAVAYTYLPLDANILGLDPVRLPSDGRVPIFRPGGFAVVGHTGELSAAVMNNQTIDCGRVRLSRVRVLGADGSVINTGYETDLEAGTVTFTNISGYVQPVTIQHRIEDMVLVSDVQITGRLKFTRPLTHQYPVGSFVSSALVAGDLFAQVNTQFDQSSWDGTFKDSQTGNTATGTRNTAQYPITVTNRGAITERWVVRFTNSTSFDVIGEHIGVIATGNTSTDCAPLNPSTGVPYFSIPAAGWGNGWATGNVFRFNTVGAMFPVWVVRTVQQGPETVTDDNFTLLIRGDVNANP